METCACVCLRSQPQPVKAFLFTVWRYHFLFAAAGRRSKPYVREPAASSAVSQRAELLLDAYGDSILRLAYSYLHNKSDAEDILQDTLIKFLQTAPQFESREHEKAWLLRVAANLSKNRIAYNRIRSTDELKEELISGQETELAFVWDAVRALPEKYREVIHLFYHEGYSTAEIAKILSKREATVRSQLHRGRAGLKEILREAYDFE